MTKQLLLFTAKHCTVCPQMHEIVHEIGLEHKDIQIHLISTDTDRELVRRFKIRGVPALVYLVDDVQEGYLNGLQKKKTILEMMEEHNEKTNL